VLAGDRTLGGFGGEWGRDGGKLHPKQEKKRELLEREGVRFDERGRVRGDVWRGFWDLEGFERAYEAID